MQKAIEIVKAWTNVVAGDAEIKALAKERMMVCSACPNNIEQLGIRVCGLCYCPLKGKVHSPVNSCDDNRWKE